MDLVESTLLSLSTLPLKQRNQLLDVFFYDVGALTRAERDGLSPWVDQKGAVIVVSPAKLERPLRQYPNAMQFLIREGSSIEALAVAGVGSSVLGTAALARNAADFYGCEVGGIVTGYGLADVMVEALGGWFFYGAIDRGRYLMEHFLARMSSGPKVGRTSGDGAAPLADFVDSPLDSFLPGDFDVSALHDILFSRYLHMLSVPMKLRLLIGHSKGNLLISFVLNYMNDELKSAALGNGIAPLNPFNNLAVVTLGAVVDIPDALIQPENQHQFLGELDLLGQTNSDRDPPFVGTIKEHTPIPGVGHHLNPEYPAAMIVGEVLKRVTLPVPPPDATPEALRRLSRAGRGDYRARRAALRL